jgi:pimeloyl-ACP methyl ester carboxylesterase
MNWLKNIFGKGNTIIQTDNFHLPVIWIHGANQSSMSFNFLRNQCNFNNEVLIEYSSMNRFYDNLNNIIDSVSRIGPCFVVGHSLGGLYGLHLTEHVEVVGGVSISTPFRGSSTADWAKYIVPQYPLFRDIGKKAHPVQSGHQIVLDIPWTQIVSTTGGVPYHNGPNDGVVTIASMTHREDMEFVEVPHTHYEVMCSNQVAQIIQKSVISVSRQ